MAKRNPYFLSVADVREIAAASGLSHAEFCVGQMASQMGREMCDAQFAELARIDRAEWDDLTAIVEGV